MLLSPLAVGVTAGGPRWVHIPLALFWLIGYFAFFATTLWLKANRRAKWFPPVRFYTLLAIPFGLIVLLIQPQVIRWIPAFLPPLAIGLWAASRRRDRDLLAGISTVVGACIMTLVAFDLGSHGLSAQAYELAIAQMLYFVGTVFYVKSAIREKDNKSFLALSIAFHLIATVSVWFLSPWLALVFFGLTLRAGFVPPLHPSPKSLGIMEIVATVAVALVSLVVI
jgi:hypothetical protein